jgi:hypothetical protein
VENITVKIPEVRNYLLRMPRKPFKTKMRELLLEYNLVRGELKELSFGEYLIMKQLSILTEIAEQLGFVSAQMALSFNKSSLTSSQLQLSKK